MALNLDALLTPDEFASLREVSKGMIQREFPEAHQQKLLGLRLIKHTPDGLRLTKAGQERMAVGK
jgi:hypothetical protein